MVYEEKLNKQALDRVIRFIRGDVSLNSKNDTPSKVYSSKVKIHKSKKKEKATREMHPVQTIVTSSDLVQFIGLSDKRPPNEIAFLEALMDSLPTSYQKSKIKIEARKTRISFFNLSLPKSQKRVARIELGKTQPDVLVRTDIVAMNPALTMIAKPSIHDKGSHMRRFRLGTIEESAMFGKALMKAIK